MEGDAGSRHVMRGGKRMATDVTQMNLFLGYCGGQEPLLVVAAKPVTQEERTVPLRLVLKALAVASQEPSINGVAVGVAVALHEGESGPESHVLVSGDYKLMSAARRALMQVAPATLIDDVGIVRGGGLRRDLRTVRDGSLWMADGMLGVSLKNLAEGDDRELQRLMPERP